MIIELKSTASVDDAARLAKQLGAVLLERDGKVLAVTSSKMKELPAAHHPLAEGVYVFDNDMQLSARAYRGARSVHMRDTEIGGESHNTVMIAGPCSVESPEQIASSAKLMHELGIKWLRGGCYKPRTSPYSFQGMGLEGLKLLAAMRDEYGLGIVTEVRDATHVDDVIEHTDIVQIGAKSMYDHGILRRCGQARKPILLKRGFATSLQEFVQAAEFILSGGNDDVILCERGIRTFVTKTRFTLDLCGVAFLKKNTGLPVVLDPSHAMGYAYGVPDLARACVAMGIDGLLIEVHPNPAVAKSDAAQQLDHTAFPALHQSLGAVAAAVGRTLV